MRYELFYWPDVEDQKREAKRRAAEFTAERLPKYFSYFEAIVDRNANRGPYFLGRKLTGVSV